MYIIFIIFIIVFITTKVRFEIKNIVDQTDVTITIGILKIHIDYDLFMKEINKITKNTKFSLEEFKKGIGFYKITKKIIRRSNVNIKNINIVRKTKEFDIINIYLNITYYSLGNYIKTFLISNTRKQENISFYVAPATYNDIDLDVDFEFSLFLFINNLLFNIKNIIKIKKDMI